MTDIAMSVSCMIDGELKIFLLENIDDNQVQVASTITNHPIPSGEYVADTMYKEPITMNVSGTFSMNGRKGLVFSRSGDISLEDIESLFERIRNEGILCDLVKVRTVDNNSPRFMIRKNMALRSISWTEKINSLGFTFSFQQVMNVNVQTYNPTTEDPNVPDTEEPKTLNFTDSLFNSEDVIAQIKDVCLKTDLMKQDFLQGIGNWYKDQAIGVAVGATAVLLAVIVAGITSGGVLLVVGIVVAVGVFLYKFVKDCIRMSKSKIRKFKYYAKNSKKSKAEYERFTNMCAEILEQFQELNKKIAVYQISANKAQQCILSIDDEYYCFTFTRNNNENSYGLTLLDLDGNIAANTNRLGNIKEGALQSLDDCGSGSTLLSTKNGYQCFVLNPNENRTDDLTECFIMVSSINMDNYNKMVADTIKTYLFY